MSQTDLEYAEIKIKTLEQIINKQQRIIDGLSYKNYLLNTSMKEVNKILRLCYENDNEINIKTKIFNPHCYSSLCKIV